jgi:hypothetical protein
MTTIMGAVQQAPQGVQHDDDARADRRHVQPGAGNHGRCAESIERKDWPVVR